MHEELRVKTIFKYKTVYILIRFVRIISTSSLKLISIFSGRSSTLGPHGYEGNKTLPLSPKNDA